VTMFHQTFEEMVRFASANDFMEELKTARKEYERRTGELFETDPGFERRIAGFLEWYVLDRALSFAPNKTPALLYIESVTPTLTTPDLNRLRSMTHTSLSLFEFRRAKEERLQVLNLLTDERIEVLERRKPLGMERGDIFEGRLIPHDDHLLFTDSLTFHPRDARRSILKAAKTFRKSITKPTQLDFVHRIAYLTNRCERYKHLKPLQIFAELVENPLQPAVSA